MRIEGNVIAVKQNPKNHFITVEGNDKDISAFGTCPKDIHEGVFLIAECKPNKDFINYTSYSVDAIQIPKADSGSPVFTINRCVAWKVVGNVFVGDPSFEKMKKLERLIEKDINDA